MVSTISNCSNYIIRSGVLSNGGIFRVYHNIVRRNAFYLSLYQWVRKTEIGLKLRSHGLVSMTPHFIISEHRILFPMNGNILFAKFVKECFMVAHEKTILTKKNLVAICKEYFILVKAFTSIYIIIINLLYILPGIWIDIS